MTHNFKANDRGFTLVELILVTLLLGVMAAIMFGSLASIRRSAETAQEVRKGERTAQYVIEKLTRELSSATKIKLYQKNDKSKASPVVGYSVFEGLNATEGSTDADSIRFVAATGGQPVFGADANNGPVEVRYFLAEPDESMRQARDTPNDKSLSLIREEYPVLVPNEEDREARKIVFPIATNITALNFRYLFDAAWQEDWTGTNGSKLPDAIEISLGISLGDSEQSSLFKTAVAVAQNSP